ncbi:MAG TPA: alpha/beta fold hydrolase [Gemmataceae bacterium]|jgi:dienelactone hydrolase
MPADDHYWDEQDMDRPRRSLNARSKPSKVWLWWLIGGFGALSACGLLCCGGGYFGIRSFLGPTQFPDQTEDYAEARAKFHTKLIRRGPAPQPFQGEWPPPGAREATYVVGGLRLKAWINQPDAAGGRKPAVLFLHGGFAFGADDWEQTRPFRDAGFVTMLPILRGENGQPGDYSMFYDEVDDVLAAADWLAKEPGVDSNRIYVSGHSVGGTLALLAAMTSKRFRAAASFSGSPDQVKWASGQMELVPFDPKDQREFQMRSPLAFARSFKCPTRLYYGSQEILFKASSEKTAELAKAAGLDVEAVSVPGDHMSAVTPGMRQAIAFFQQHK